MAKIEIAVKPGNKSHEAWFVHLFSWNASGRDVVTHRLKLIKGQEGDETFVLQSVADLPSANYRVMLHVLKPDNEVSITVTGKPEVTYPFGKNWPMKVSVPNNYTQASDVWAFIHSGA